MVKTGQRIPVDGMIEEGQAALDESDLTGESMPVDRAAGDRVISGTFNRAGYLKIRAERVGGDSTLARMIRLVEQASQSKAPIARLADRVCYFFVPAVIAVALVSLVGWMAAGEGFSFALARAIAVLVISCPCALVLSIPLGFFAGIGRAARQGILLKGSNYLGALRKVKTVVFDKTGTLTEGVFSVDEVLPRDGVSPEELLYWAAHAELSASHPLGRSIVKAYEGTLFPDRVAELVEVTGGGVSARVEGRPVLVGKKSFLQEAGVRTEEGEDHGLSLIHISEPTRH